MDKAIFRLDVDLYPHTITGMNQTGDDLENGAFVQVGVILDNEHGREVYELDKFNGDANKVIGFISSPSVMYESSKDERDFVCENDELVRAYVPNATTVGTFAKKHFDTPDALVVGDFLAPKNTTNQLEKTSNAGAIAQVVALENFEGQDSIVIKFL